MITAGFGDHVGVMAVVKAYHGNVFHQFVTGIAFHLVYNRCSLNTLTQMIVDNVIIIIQKLAMTPLEYVVCICFE